MPWIVYETTNKINGKKYVGVHKQDGDEFDGYLGSGKSLASAIGKYGRDNFERRTLHSFESEQEAYACEAEIVTEEWCKRTDNYNLKPGGFGGWPLNVPEFVANRNLSVRSINYRAKKSESTARLWSSPEYRETQRKSREATYATPAYREKRAAISAEAWANPESGSKMRALRASEDFKKKQSLIRKDQWRDPEYRARQAASGWMNPDYRARQSESRRAAWVRRRLAKANATLCILTRELHVSQSA